MSRRRGRHKQAGQRHTGAWWNGRHGGLKIHWPRGREGSSPSAPTQFWPQTPCSEACWDVLGPLWGVWGAREIRCLSANNGRRRSPTGHSGKLLSALPAAI